MRFALTVGAVLAAVCFLSTPARADVADDPCTLLEEGDACEDLAGNPGVCVEGGFEGLYCNTEVGQGGAGGGGTAGAPNTGGDGTGGSGSSTGTGTDTGTSAPTGGSTEDDDSCTVTAVGTSGSAEAAGLLALLGACYALRNRRIRRS